MTRATPSKVRDEAAACRARRSLLALAWCLAVVASAALSHFAIERIDDLGGTASGYASHAHPAFVPLVLLMLGLAGIALWKSVARRVRARERHTAAALGSSVRVIPFVMLLTCVFGGALALLAASETIEVAVTTGHATVSLIFGDRPLIGMLAVALAAYIVTLIGSSVARTAIRLLVAGVRAIEMLAQRARARIGQQAVRVCEPASQNLCAPLARCRALRAPPSLAS